MEKRNKIYKLTVDVVIEKNSKILLIKRLKEPFKNKLALPGGHVEKDELVEDAAIRETKEETGFDIKLLDILGVYSDPKRDPRKRTSVVFVGKIISGRLKEGTDAAEAKFYEIEKLDKKNIAFDHYKIIMDYQKYKKFGGTYWSSKK